MRQSGHSAGGSGPDLGAMSEPRTAPAAGDFSGLRILGHVDELMFNEGELRLALEAQTKKMAAAVDAESE
jgi:hypothetical protein